MKSILTALLFTLLSTSVFAADVAPSQNQGQAIDALIQGKSKLWITTLKKIIKS